jgi:biopolymer transport protein ExbD
MDARGGSGANGVQAAINVTPLVDVCLVLLIIFMAAVPVVRVGYAARVPPQAVAPAPPAPQLVLQLRADGSIFANSDPLPAGSARARLAALAKGREADVAFVAADGTVPYQKVMAFVDLCHDAGFANLGIVLDEMPH